VGFNVLESDRELIGIAGLGPAAKPRALKLLDDQLEPFDLVVAALDNRCNVAHETMQQNRIGWKVIEIKLHDKSYANALIRSSNFPIFHAGFFSRRARASKCAPACASQCLRSTLRACAGVSVTVPQTRTASARVIGLEAE